MIRDVTQGSREVNEDFDEQRKTAAKEAASQSSSKTFAQPQVLPCGKSHALLKVQAPPKSQIEAAPSLNVRKPQVVFKCNGRKGAF